MQTDRFDRDARAVNIPPATGLLAVVCVLVQVSQIFLGPEGLKTLTFAGFSPEVFYAGMVGYQLPHPILTWLSPLTYGFLHGGWAHLLINMAFLLAFGSGLERLLGPVRLIVFFLVLDVLSTLGPIITYMLTGNGPFMIGASGAISGLLGGYLRLRPTGGLTALLVYIATNLAIALYGSSLGGELAYIAWEAHVAGAIAGYLLLPLARRNWFMRRR